MSDSTDPLALATFTPSPAPGPLQMHIAPSHRFRKGRSGNPAGKARGVQNKVTVEARQAAAEIVDNPDYRAALKARAFAGRLAPAVEVMLWHYAHGAPKIKLDVDAKVTDVTKMTTEDLRAEIAELLARL